MKRETIPDAARYPAAAREEERPPVITGVSKVVVPVADQDQATKFWTEVIGFRLLRDEIYAGSRWIEVMPRIAQ